MYVLIDLERMAVLYKHSKRAVLDNLAHIELNYCASAIIPADKFGEGYFKSMTDLELKTLLLNTTGRKLETFSRLHLLEQVFDALKAVPESDVQPFEVSLQADKIPFTCQKNYKYTKGSNKPVEVAELFVAPPLKALDNPPKQPTAAPKPEGNSNPWAWPLKPAATR